MTEDGGDRPPDARFIPRPKGDDDAEGRARAIEEIARALKEDPKAVIRPQSEKGPIVVTRETDAEAEERKRILREQGPARPPFRPLRPPLRVVDPNTGEVRPPGKGSQQSGGEQPPTPKDPQGPQRPGRG